MAEIIRNRTIRPSSRLESSKSYKIDTKSVESGDILQVNINHESKPFNKTYLFAGKDIAHKVSISFRVFDFGTNIEIKWSGANPIGTSKKNPVAKNKLPTPPGKIPINKTSFEPIISPNSKILILGTMPGDLSLGKGEYYAHPRNRFWKILSSISGIPIPGNYDEKKSLLAKMGISLWDVLASAQRPGSLDHHITNEVPNDLNNFQLCFPSIKLIAFNGTKAASLFEKWNHRNSQCKYITLPSSSPANAGITFEKILQAWSAILHI